MTSMQSVEVLAIRYASLAETTRSAVDTASERQDETTSNILQDIWRRLDKNLWFLEAHLQDRPTGWSRGRHRT